MITIRFSNKGESGAIPITADNLNLLIDQINESLTRTQHITGDTNGTHFTSGVYANGHEMVADDDYPDPSATQVNNIESEESN